MPASTHYGYKKAQKGYIVKLRITGNNNEHRPDVRRKNIKTAKMRCKKAKVLDIYHMNNKNKRLKKINGIYDPKFMYEVGKEVSVKDYNPDIDKVCDTGIHYFLSEYPAVCYNESFPNQGLHQVWHDNGQINGEYTFKEGQLNGECKRWDKNGKLSGKSTYVNGNLHGEYLSWYENGKLMLKCTFVNEMPDGEHVQFHPNGKPSRIINYKNGSKEGIARTWNVKGRLMSEQKFINDRVIGLSKFYDENGNSVVRRAALP